MAKDAQPVATWTLRDFPVELRAAVERVKWERKVAHPEESVTNSVIVAEAIRAYLARDKIGSTQTEQEIGKAPEA